MEDEIKSAMTSPTNRSATLGILALALSKAQGQMEGARKDSANPFFTSRYSDLAAVIEAAKAPLAANELAYIQLAGQDDHGLFINTLLIHSSGEWIEGRLYMNPVKQDPQGIGSALTYGRRYSLQAMLGIPSVDDDGEAAMGRENGPAKKSLPPTKPLAPGTYQQAKTVSGPATPAPDNGNKEPVITSWREITSHMGTKSGILGKKLGTLIPEAIAMLERKVAEIKSPTKQDSILIAALAMRRAELEEETSRGMLFEKCKALKITLESVVAVNKRMGSKAETFDSIPESEAKALLDDWEGTQAQAFDEMADTLPMGDK